MEGRGVSDQLDLAQGAGGRRQDAGGLDHRSHDDAELIQKARAEFEVESKKTPYFSLVPPDAKPDLELNKAEMEKYPRRHEEVLSEQDAAV
jgi:hypothetical protein